MSKRVLTYVCIHIWCSMIWSIEIFFWFWLNKIQFFMCQFVCVCVCVCVHTHMRVLHLPPGLWPPYCQACPISDHTAPIAWESFPHVWQFGHGPVPTENWTEAIYHFIPALQRWKESSLIQQLPSAVSSFVPLKPGKTNTISGFFKFSLRLVSAQNS